MESITSLMVLLITTFSFPFSASWAAMSYPEIQSLVLDASFDDLLPLALKVMPDSWSESYTLKCNVLQTLLFVLQLVVLTVEMFCSLLGPLVQHTVRQYMNLNNAEQLIK